MDGVATDADDFNSGDFGGNDDDDAVDESVSVGFGVEVIVDFDETGDTEAKVDWDSTALLSNADADDFDVESVLLGAFVDDDVIMMGVVADVAGILAEAVDDSGGGVELIIAEEVASGGVAMAAGVDAERGVATGGVVMDFVAESDTVT